MVPSENWAVGSNLALGGGQGNRASTCTRELGTLRSGAGAVLRKGHGKDESWTLKPVAKGLRTVKQSFYFL